MRFKQFLIKLSDRKRDNNKNKFAWKHDDVEHHKEPSKQGKFVWGPKDVEHHGKVDESLDEKVKLDKDAKGNYANPTQMTQWNHKNGAPEPGSESHEAFLNHHEHLNSDENDALRDYKGIGYESINDHLRTAPGKFKKERAEHFKKKAAISSKLKFVGSDSDPNKKLSDLKNNTPHERRRSDNNEHDYDNDYLEDRIHHLDSVTSHRTVEPHTVYRGGIPGDKSRFPVGHEFTDHGYTSTSFSRRTASDFSKGKHIHVIHVPKGSRGHYFDVQGEEAEHSNSGEQEFVLNRGTRFKVTHHTTDEYGNHYIHSRIVKQGIRPETRMIKKQNPPEKPKDDHGLPGQKKFPFMKHHKRFKAK